MGVQGMSKKSQIDNLVKQLRAQEKGLKLDIELVDNGKRNIATQKAHGLKDHGNSSDVDDLAYWLDAQKHRENLVLQKRRQIFATKQKLSRLGITAVELRHMGL